MYSFSFVYGWFCTHAALVEALDQSVRMQSMVEVVQFMPWLEPLPKLLLPRNKLLMHNVRMRDEYAAQQLAEHKRTINMEHPRDFIDAYLIAMHEKQLSKQPTTFDGASCASHVNLRRASLSFYHHVFHIRFHVQMP